MNDKEMLIKKIQDNIQDVEDRLRVKEKYLAGMINSIPEYENEIQMLQNLLDDLIELKTQLEEA